MNSSAFHAAQRRIQPLPVHLANQIAAGEVVERPASVVKELLENSIDAGARYIELEVERGGLRLIRVLDDGAGIHPDDLPLTTAPHATSKVYSQQELQQVLSLGFRGEALASIASVSRFSVASRQPQMEQGLRLMPSSGNSGTELLPCAMPPGTRIEVRELFYNIPARRKFLRSERTEYLHLEEVLKRLALSRYDIGFRLLHNGRQQFNLAPVDAPEQRAQRVAAVLGKSFLQHALEVEFEAAGMRLWGWVGAPGYSRGQADAQYFYLNGRMIRDKLVSHAVRQAHQTVLEPGRYPAYLLYLEIAPQQVDINVHPTKHEVRFREARLVHDFLLRALLRVLEGGTEPQPRQEAPCPVASRTGRPQGAIPESARVAEQTAFYRQSLTLAPRPARGAVAVPAPVSAHLLAVVHGSYLLLQRDGVPGVLAVAAARQRLLARRLRDALASGEMASQPLLIPATVRLAAGQIGQLERHAATLLRLGMEVERLGEEAVVVRQLPLSLRSVEPAQLLCALCAFLVAAPDIEGAREAFVEEVAGLLAPLLPPADMASGAVLLRELEQLLRDGGVSEAELPWRPLSEERLAALFATTA
ncbi:MAG: DNA mismatch repair endonuclease MutL [Gammaproteobacteria bacterium]|nr:DNA mismatch repair endonuclease MutL [Gammaproteobacteria bacterium]